MPARARAADRPAGRAAARRPRQLCARPLRERAAALEHGGAERAPAARSSLRSSRHIRRSASISKNARAPISLKPSPRARPISESRRRLPCRKGSRRSHSATIAWCSSSARGDPLSGSRQTRLADVVERDFVGLPRESALQRHIAGHAARLGTTMKVRARVTGFDAVCRMVESGVGVAIVPETAARRCRRAMKIDVIGLRDAWARRRLAICVRRLQALPIGARRLVEHLRSAENAKR